jgi:Leucine-rich repeat (LRR) protein
VKYFVRAILLPTILALAVSGWSVGTPSQSTGAQTTRESDEERAIAALTKLNVPLGRDPDGRVRWLEAPNGELGDEALHYLASLPLLEWLELGGGKVTITGIASLKGCKALKRLYLHDIDLSKDGLAWIADLRLEALSLQRTAIAGSALKQLKDARTLTVLNLSENPITDEDLGQVARFTNLEVLALQNTKVAGAGLAKLEKMARLNVLNLVNCRIVDADLSHFLSMPNLRIVHASGCEISDQAVKDITAKLQMLAIFR